MKRILFITLLSITSIVFCQEYIDVVYLKNGSVIKGVIIEQIPNKSLKIETADGSIFVYKIEQISKISKIKKINDEDGYSYNNLIGGMYLNPSGTPIYAINSLQRISNNLNFGFLTSTYYMDDNLPGQSSQYVPYIGFDLMKSKSFTPLLVVGGVLSIREWSSINYYWGGVNGTVSHFGPMFGLGLNVKLLSNFGVGFILAMTQSWTFTAYSDGSAETSNNGYELYPALTINLYDIFPKRKF